MNDVVTRATHCLHVIFVVSPPCAPPFSHVTGLNSSTIMLEAPPDPSTHLQPPGKTTELEDPGAEDIGMRHTQSS